MFWVDLCLEPLKFEAVVHGRITTLGNESFCRQNYIKIKSRKWTLLWHNSVLMKREIWTDSEGR